MTDGSASVLGQIHLINPAQSGTPPAAPGSLTATTLGNSGIQLGWTDNSDDEAGFRVYRSMSAGGPFHAVIDVPAESDSHVDSGLAPATTYYYFVTAFNVAGESGTSGWAHATTAAAPALILGVTRDSESGPVVEPNSIVAYPDVTQGSPVLRVQFVLHNLSPPGSGTTLTVNSVTSSNPLWTITDDLSNQTLHPGGIRFLPLEMQTGVLGTQDSDIRIESDDPLSPFVIKVRATVFVAPPEVMITQQPVDQYVPEGATAEFTVAASGGSGVLRYQWFTWGGPFGWMKVIDDEVHFQGAGTSSLTVSDASTSVANVDWASVFDQEDPTNAADSDQAHLVIEMPQIAITYSPVEAWAGPGETAVFRIVAAGGAGPLAYQWMLDGADLDGDHACAALVTGERTSILTVTPAFGVPGCQPWGQYRVRVEDGHSLQLSNVARLFQGRIPGQDSRALVPVGETFSIGRFVGELVPEQAPPLAGKPADYGGVGWAADERLVFSRYGGCCFGLGENGAVTNETSAGGGPMVATVPMRVSERALEVTLDAWAGLTPTSGPSELGRHLALGFTSSPDGSFGADGQIWVQAKQIGDGSQVSWKLCAQGGIVLASGLEWVEAWQGGQQWILSYEPSRRLVHFSKYPLTPTLPPQTVVLPPSIELDIAHAGFQYRPPNGQAPPGGFAVERLEVRVREGGETPELVDEFETGDFSAWSSVVDPADQMALTSMSISGSQSLELQFGGKDDPAYLQHDLRHSTSELSASLLLDVDPEMLWMGELGVQRLFEVGSTGASGEPPAFVDLRFAEGFFEVRAGARTAAGGAVFTAWQPLDPEPTRLQLSWSNVHFGYSMVALGVDGQWTSPVSHDGHLDAGYLRLGPSVRLDPGTRGTLRIDAFESSKRTAYDYLGGEGFESGNLSGWETVLDPAERLEVTEDAALVGDYGLRISLDGTTELALRRRVTHRTGDTIQEHVPTRCSSAEHARRWAASTRPGPGSRRSPELRSAASLRVGSVLGAGPSQW